MPTGDRIDPYRAYYFQVELDGINRAGFRECSGLDTSQDPIEYREGNEVQKYPSQLNLGLSPGDAGHQEPYFYSNPWPFEKELLNKPLPAGARWFTDGWEGTIFPYAELAGEANAEERLLDYARAVYQAAAPTLTA